MKRVILALMAAAITISALTGTAQAAVAPAAVMTVFQATDTRATGGVYCVSDLPARTGHATTIGLAEYGSIYLDTRRVCNQITQWAHGATLWNWTVLALVAVGHEAAHLRGVSRESRAECLGVRFADAYMSRHGVYRKYVRSGIVRDLMSNEARPAAYRISSSTCHLVTS
jgi:hypothetical protein